MLVHTVQCYLNKNDICWREARGGGLIVSYDIGLLGPERNGLEPVWPKNEYEKIVDIVPVGILFCFFFWLKPSALMMRYEKRT